MNIIDIIDNYSTDATRIAHIYRDSSMTYKELVAKSNALACYLIQNFKEDKTPIVVYGHKEHEMLICFLACVKAGHAYIPVDSSLPYDRVRSIIDNSESKIVFCVEELENTQGQNFKTLNEILEIISSHAGQSPEPCYRVSAEDVYYIIYTSGSTGKPKGVQITLSCLHSFIKWGLSLGNFHSSKKNVFMNQAPFSFDLSVMDLYLSLASGSTLFSIDKKMIADLRELFVFLKESDISAWVSTPSFAEMCLADKSFNRELLPKLEVMLFCGEILSNECVKRLHDRFSNLKVVNSYGPTEATVAITAMEVTDEICEAINPLPVGYVKGDCQLLIADPKGNPVPDGEKGEILIIGDSVSPGYYKNQEITDKVFSKRVMNGLEKRCYRTGDEGYIKDNLLYYSGRIDFQVKLNGYRIEIEDIENNLRKVPQIKNAVVLPIIDGAKVKYLLGVVVPENKIVGSQLEAGIKVKNELKALIPEYMIPKRIKFRDVLPMNANGKVDRKSLLEELS